MTTVDGHHIESADEPDRRFVTVSRGDLTGEKYFSREVLNRPVRRPPSPADWFPDRPPIWSEVLVLVIAVGWLVAAIASPGHISWPAVAAGFLATAVAIGPLANSRLGSRIGDWALTIGVLGRLGVIALIFLGWWLLAQTVEVPGPLVASVANGAMAAVAVYVLAHVALARGVDGWTAT